MTGRIVVLTSLVALGLSATCLFAAEPTRPNMVWIFVDDMSANFSCYGETTIQTPHVDRLVREGMRCSRAFVTVPVCSPRRSALITGCYQTTIGAHHHRSGRSRKSGQLTETENNIELMKRWTREGR